MNLDSALPDPSLLQNPGGQFAPTSIAAVTAGQQKQAAMMPFLQMAQQSQAEDLADKQYKNKEYQSDIQRLGREGEAKSKAAKGRYDMETNDSRILQEQLKASVAPHQAMHDIAELDEQVRQFQDSPYKQAYTTVAAAFPDFNKGPDGKPRSNAEKMAMYPSIYDSVIKMYPSLQGKIPQSYTPAVGQLMANMYQMVVHDAEFQKQQQQQKQKDDAAMARERVQAGATVQSATIQAQQRDREAELVQGNRQQQEDTRRQTSIETAIKNHPTIKMVESADAIALMQLKMQPQTSAVKQRIEEMENDIRQKYQDVRQEVEKQYPATKPPQTAVPVGRVRVKDKTGRFATIPKEQLDAAKSQGFTEVK